MPKRPRELAREGRMTRGRVIEATKLDQGLCRRCAKIDLDAIFRRKHNTINGDKVMKLGRVNEWSPDSCLLCDLFTKSRLSEPDPDVDPYTLYSFSTDRISDRGWKTVQTGMLSLYPDGKPSSIVSQLDHNGSECIRIISPLLDMKVVEGWLTFCLDNHTKRCSMDPCSSSSTSSSHPLLSEIPSFKLIDCHSRRIVPALSQPYATLSYVWGTSSKESYTDSLPSTLPATIEDALSVTKGLGLKFLWIDRYCINQENPQELSEQISHMDLIYSQSHFTIVAAAGNDPHHGLPGISLTRTPQPHAQIGHHCLVSTLGDPILEIKKSSWMQRAWTYQEGLLSRRRIVFTEQQVYYECAGMYCCEELQFPLRSLHTPDGQRFRASFCQKENTGMFPQQLGSSGWEIAIRIWEYSNKLITDPSDILNGISGVLRAFERHPTQIRNCHGVPMFPKAPRPSELGRGSRDRAKQIQQNLKWTPTIGLCAGLCWRVLQPSERRAGFPSWSWTGWEASIEWIMGDWCLFQGNEDFKVKIQLQDGRDVDWDEMQRLYDDTRGLMSTTLHIRAWASAIHVLRSRVLQPGEDYFGPVRYIAEIIVEDQGLVYWEFYPTTNAPLSETYCVAIHLGHDFGGFDLRHYLLIVRKMDDDTWERVGIGYLGVNEIQRTPQDSEEFEWRGIAVNRPLPILRKVLRRFKLS